MGEWVGWGSVEFGGWNTGIEASQSQIRRVILRCASGLSNGIGWTRGEVGSRDMFAAGERLVEPRGEFFECFEVGADRALFDGVDGGEAEAGGRGDLALRLQSRHR